MSARGRGGGDNGGDPQNGTASTKITISRHEKNSAWCAAGRDSLRNRQRSLLLLLMLLLCSDFCIVYVTDSGLAFDQNNPSSGGNPVVS